MTNTTSRKPLILAVTDLNSAITNISDVDKSSNYHTYQDQI